MSVQRTPLIVLGAAMLALVGFCVMLRTSPRAVAEAERAAALRAAQAGEGPVASGPASLESLLAVDALPARRQAARASAAVRASLKALRSVDLAAEVDGRVIEVAAQEHEHVEAGGVLVRLDPTLLAAARKRAEATVLRTQSAHHLAELELKRQRDLAERQIASAADLDRAESEERTSYAAWAEARASLADARARLDKTVVAAPFAGVVNRLDVEVGAYLRPGDRVAELLDISEIELEVGVSDRQVVVLRPGDPVAVEIDVYPGERFEGAIAGIGRAADEKTQQYPVEVRVPNPGERLLPGMLGRVRLEVRDERDAIHVPRRATQREFQLDYLFVLEGEGDVATVRRRRVATRPVPFRPDLLEVTEGLSAGEWVAVSHVRELRDGQRVRIRRDEG